MDSTNYKTSLVETIYNFNSNYFLIIQKHFCYYSSESRKLIHSLPRWMADLKPTMDYKVRLKVKRQDLAVRKVEGQIAVKKYNKSLLKKKKKSLAEL